MNFSDPSLNGSKREHIYSSSRHEATEERHPLSTYVAFYTRVRSANTTEGSIPTLEFYIGQFEWRNANTDPQNLPIQYKGQKP